MAKDKSYKVSSKDVTNLHTIAFLIDTEADSLQQKGVDVPASDLNQTTVGLDGLTAVEFLRGLAQWFREFADRIKR